MEQGTQLVIYCWWKSHTDCSPFTKVGKQYKVFTIDKSASVRKQKIHPCHQVKIKQSTGLWHSIFFSIYIFFTFFVFDSFHLFFLYFVCIPANIYSFYCKYTQCLMQPCAIFTLYYWKIVYYYLKSKLLFMKCTYFYQLLVLYVYKHWTKEHWFNLKLLTIVSQFTTQHMCGSVPVLKKLKSNKLCISQYYWLFPMLHIFSLAKSKHFRFFYEYWACSHMYCMICVFWVSDGQCKARINMYDLLFSMMFVRAQVRTRVCACVNLIFNVPCIVSHTTKSCLLKLWYILV